MAFGVAVLLPEMDGFRREIIRSHHLSYLQYDIDGAMDNRDLRFVR